jgi:hypothetical protein
MAGPASAGYPAAHRADARALVVGERGESGDTVCASAGRALAPSRPHAFTRAFEPRLIPLGGFHGSRRLCRGLGVLGHDGVADDTPFHIRAQILAAHGATG